MARDSLFLDATALDPLVGEANSEPAAGRGEGTIPGFGGEPLRRIVGRVGPLAGWIRPFGVDLPGASAAPRQTIEDCWFGLRRAAAVKGSPSNPDIAPSAGAKRRVRGWGNKRTAGGRTGRGTQAAGFERVPSARGLA